MRIAIAGKKPPLERASSRMMPDDRLRDDDEALRGRSDVVEGVTGDEGQSRILRRLEDAHGIRLDNLAGDHAIESLPGGRLELDPVSLAQPAEVPEMGVPMG